MSRFIIQLVCLLFCTSTIYCQNYISGSVFSQKDETPIEGCYILLQQNKKTLKTTSTDKNGDYKLNDILKGKYILEVVCLGYKSIIDTLDITESCRHIFELEEEVNELNEVTVEFDRSKIVKRTANGQIFYLSSSAKKMSNPFMALQEIPEIISDANTSSIKMSNGDAPLILINGNIVNSGISPISPSDIESVEVINSVSARYQQDGVKSILNIKLKRHVKPYVWLEGATRHDIPTDNGFGVGYFEIGNHEVSLYGRIAYNYTYHDDINTDVNRTNTGYNQKYTQYSRNDANKWIGELLLKYQITEKDYFAVHVYDSNNITDEKSDANGYYFSNIQQIYSFNSFSKNKSNIFTSSMYYKHSFSKDNDLELRLAYNYNKNDYNAEQTEFYDEKSADANICYHNKRHSVSFYADYSKVFNTNSSLIAGSHSTFVSDDIDEIIGTNPIFRHTNYNHYLYLGYGGTYKKLYYNVSVGIEGIFAKAGDVSYNYFRPRGNASVTLFANNHNSTRLSYTLSNDVPNVAFLNPYNTSTDSLVVSTGNPNLRPQITHNVNISHTVNIGNLYLVPNANYKYVCNLIENYGYTNKNIYYSTYINAGHFSGASAGANISYRFKWGRIYAGGGWSADYFMKQRSKDSAYASFGYNARVNKLSFYGDFDYNSRSYTVVTCTRYNRPSMANIQINYNFTPDFYIGVGLQHITGKYSTKSTTNDGTFHSITKSYYKDKELRPWFILRYTFRKNIDKKHKLGKVLNSTEEGINIIR